MSMFASIDYPITNTYQSDAKKSIETEKKYLSTLNEFLKTITPTYETNETTKHNELVSNWINQAIYYFTVNFGLFKTFLESFVSLKVTLDSFNFLTSSAINLISLAFGFLNLVLFYAFEVSLIRESLKIDATISESVELLHLYQEQLSVAKDINELFFNRTNLECIPNESFDYKEKLKFVNEMNQSFKDKIKEQQPLSLPKLALKYSLYILGAISCVVGEYFVSQYMLQALNDIINLSPTAHWILTALWLVYVLATYNALSGSSVLSLINPEYAKLKELNKEYNLFQKQTQTSQDFINKTRH